MENEEQWKALADLLRWQRVSVLGYTKRVDFVRALELSNDRVLYDLENARRHNYDIDTLLSLESWYKLTSAQLREVLGDLYPLADRVTRHEIATITSRRSENAETVEQLQESIEIITDMLDKVKERLGKIGEQE